MSKFSKMIRAHQTEKRYMEREENPLGFLFSAEEVPTFEVSHFEQEYRFKIEIGGIARISPKENLGAQIEHHRRRIAQMMVEAIFGEFMGDLYRARHEIHMGNYKEAERLIVKITETMQEI